MSHQASAWALDARQTGRLGAGARLVLATLADYADPQGHGAYPSKPTIAARLDLDVDTVRKHLRTLEAAGLILRGDQALVAHYPADKRPTVYNLLLKADPSEVRPRQSDPSEHAAATPQNVPDRPLKSEAQTKNITTHENHPPTPHGARVVVEVGECPSCGQRRSLVADGLCRICLGATAKATEQEDA